MKKLTKWYANANVLSLQGLVIEEDTGRTVAVSYDPKDAYLLAAAPKLYEALKEAQEELYALAAEKIGSRRFQDIDDAIAEAEGGAE